MSGGIWPLISHSEAGGVAPMPSGNVTDWPRRGATIAGSLLDTRWDILEWAKMLGGIFDGRGLTQVNVLSADWPGGIGFSERPFIQLPDGRFDLRTANPKFYSRLARYVETMNHYGVVVQLCFLELYSWAYRKHDVPFDKDFQPFRYNINGIYWAGKTRAEEDMTLSRLPDDFVVELLERVLQTVRGAGVAIVPGNEFPEKPVHLKIAEVVKRVAPEVRVVVNRNEDTPGQYMNMGVGEGLVDMIAFHGWKRMGFLTEEFPREPAKRPRTFKQFFDKRSADGRVLDIDISRVIASSDGSRSSGDPVNTYDWGPLLEVFRFVASKGGNIEHQSRAKMTTAPALHMVEVDFLKQIAEL